MYATENFLSEALTENLSEARKVRILNYLSVHNKQEDVRQSIENYKDNADTIIGNMDSRIFLGGSEPTTLKELNQALGKETIDLYNTSDTRGNSPSYGTNYQKVGHDLASVDELAVLDGGKCILQLRGVRPFKSDKYDLTQHPNYKLTAGADKKNTFSIEAFLDHRLKLKPGDKYEVVDADHAK